MSVLTVSRTTLARGSRAVAPFPTGSCAGRLGSPDDMGEPPPSADLVGESWIGIPGEPSDLEPLVSIRAKEARKK